MNFHQSVARMSAVRVGAVCLGLVGSAMLFAGAASAADLTITVKGVASAEGTVRVALFDQAAKFPRTVFQGQETAAAPGSVSVVFKDLAAGDYAVSAFHDVNGNKKLDTSAVGAPSEPYGFSNGARGSFGPPSFADAQFHVGDAAASQTVTLK